MRLALSVIPNDETDADEGSSCISGPACLYLLLPWLLPGEVAQDTKKGVN